MFQSQTVEWFRKVWAIKMDTTKHLDSVSRKICPSLEKFVLFSSIAAGRGSPGQTNYSLANTAAERVVEARRAAGYPSLAIEWGPIADVGLAANLKMHVDLLHQSINSCLNTLNIFLRSDHCVVSSMVIPKLKWDDDEDQNKAFFTKLANALGLETFSDLPAESKLVDFGMDSFMEMEVKAIIDSKRSTSMPLKQLRQLTIGQLNEFLSESNERMDEEQK